VKTAGGERPGRHARQTAVPEFGPETQVILSNATVAIVGCGALGSMQAELLARMGVGALRLADGDVVTLGNLHRQVLFTERDAEEGAPKVAAAAARLAELDRRVAVHGLAERITRRNIASFAEGADLLLDASDNAATRFLINDYCVRSGLPWIYAGVAGTAGLVFPVLPAEGPCLRCLYPDPPAEEDAATCAASGILPTTVALAVSLQITQAVRVLNRSAKPGELIRLDAWAPAVRAVAVRRDPDCVCCGQRRFEFLEDDVSPAPPLASSLCGQRAIRIEAAFWGNAPFDAAAALRRAQSHGAATERKGLLWIVLSEGRRISLFPDGHLFVHDCAAPEEALALAHALFA
jgi:adenylyltransferase/sulfurtransferase